MKKYIFITLLLQSISFNIIAQTNGEFFNLAGLFNESDLITPVDDERYFIAPNGIYAHAQVMNIPASSQADLLQKVLIIVDSTLYSELTFEINRYAYDIHHVYGCNVIMEWVVSETCQDIKSLILNYSYNLDGCVFIGDIVPAWYETSDVIHHNFFTSWPCDLFYMDLTGSSWPDINNNGRFDHYDGDMKPEIFIGRISTTNMGSLIGESEGMRLYMDKNHRYWTGHRIVNKKYGLAYTNWDWQTYDYFKNDIKALYGNANQNSYFPSNHTTFGKEDFLNRINDQKYEFVQLASHSDSTKHTSFYGATGSIINGHEIFYNGIKSLGFNLFCCNACRWTAATQTDAFLAGDYIYSPKSESLSLVGSTKVGGMYPFADFYSSLGHEKTMGQALIDWWDGESYLQPSVDSTLCWFFGLTIIGDPLVNFFHCTNGSCKDQITLISYDNSNSPLSYYLASESITVAPTSGSFTIPMGDHCILNAPTVVIDGEFLCPSGSTLEILNEGCKDNCDE